MRSHTAIPGASTGASQRIEIITGHERRRRYSDAAKARLVAETFEGGESVHTVARRHGICSSLLYRWRRNGIGVQQQAGVTAPLIPVQIASPEHVAARSTTMDRVERLVEIVLPNGCRVHIDQHVDGRALRRILAALRE
jgi:transposase